jgi:glycosyltransferase involved in cell wall biosynthesis
VTTRRIIPASAVVPTKDRASALRRTLESLAGQGVLPAELIVVDGSDGNDSRTVVDAWGDQARPEGKVHWLRARELGAAAQRNQGIAAASQPFVWFFDDDILFEPQCVLRLWTAIEHHPGLGGVSAMITNQRYAPPGRVSRTVFALLNGGYEPTFAGRIIGPAVHLLPEDRDDLPEVVPTEWLNTTCTMYRREALPSPPFDSVFTGYSMMEDVSLSVRVARDWRLANARTARIFHDSQPGSHKADPRLLAEMELVNRHYVMTRILNRRGLVNELRLVVWELFQLASCAASATSRRHLPAFVKGKIRAIHKVRAGTYPCP